MSLREWLIIIGVAIIVGLVIDGVRRVRRARQDSLEISRGMGADELDASPIDDEFNPELPNGGARTIDRGDDDDNRPRRSRFQQAAMKPTRRIIDQMMAGTRREPAEPEHRHEPELPDDAAVDEHFIASREDETVEGGRFSAFEPQDMDDWHLEDSPEAVQEQDDVLPEEVLSDGTANGDTD